MEMSTLMSVWFCAFLQFPKKWTVKNDKCQTYIVIYVYNKYYIEEKIYLILLSKALVRYGKYLGWSKKSNTI